MLETQWREQKKIIIETGEIAQSVKVLAVKVPGTQVEANRAVRSELIEAMWKENREEIDLNGTIKGSSRFSVAAETMHEGTGGLLQIS